MNAKKDDFIAFYDDPLFINEKIILKYKWVLILFILIAVFFFLLPYSIYGITGLTPILWAIGGLLFSVPINYFWRVYNEPFLQISKDIEIRGDLVVRNSNIFADQEIWKYKANRIIVENVGRSAAKNCKGWILTENCQERVCWTIPKERPNATINIKDAERLDFCAYKEIGSEEYTDFGGDKKNVPKICASDENNLPVTIQTADLKSLDSLTDCTVLITSDNAEPVDAKVRFGTDKIKVEP